MQHVSVSIEVFFKGINLKNVTILNKMSKIDHKKKKLITANENNFSNIHGEIKRFNRRQWQSSLCAYTLCMINDLCILQNVNDMQNKCKMKSQTDFTFVDKKLYSKPSERENDEFMSSAIAKATPVKFIFVFELQKKVN